MRVVVVVVVVVVALYRKDEKPRSVKSWLYLKPEGTASLGWSG